MTNAPITLLDGGTGQARALPDGAVGAGKPVWLSVAAEDRDGTKPRPGEPVVECGTRLACRAAIAKRLVEKGDALT